MARYIKNVSCSGLLCLAFVALSAPPAFAGVISTVGVILGPSGSTIAVSILPATSPNNDNAVTASPNVLIASKTFVELGFIDVEYLVTNSGGTTEYFLDERALFGGVRNLSGVAWTGYNVELGFGTGTGFVPSSALDSLDFDMPNADPAPTNDTFATLNHQTDRLTWTGGLLPDGGLMSATMSIDVPDVSGGIPTFATTQTGYRFTVRQYVTPAAVPEPVTGMLLGLGLAALTASRRAKNDR